VAWGRVEGSTQPRALLSASYLASTHLTVTVLVAEPPRLLRTVIFSGFVGHVNWPPYLPPPLLLSVPMAWPVEHVIALRVIDYVAQAGPPGVPQASPELREREREA
jgi:hypothetical protein